MQNTINTLLARKGKAGERIAMVTAYDYTMARLVSGAGADMLLVGDSLGMVMLGYEDTLSVTMEDMIHHSRAVARGRGEAFLVVDMPFMSYQTGMRDAMVNAGRLMKEGRAQAVKLEGGAEICNIVRALVASGIPVCGHIGLTPQSVNALGGYRVQGRDVAAAQKLLDDARALSEAGCFAIVLECIPAPLARKITESIEAIVIGIGAGVDCDGQVLVLQDLCGMYPDMRPKFVKCFGNVGTAIGEAVAAYCGEVRDGSFPGPAHSFILSDEVLAQLR